MGYLSGELRDMGFVPTGEESPVDEEGILWANNAELVCDETGVVIDGNHRVPEEHGSTVHRYQNSGKVKLIGGYTGSYNWGRSDDGFRY